MLNERPHAAPTATIDHQDGPTATHAQVAVTNRIANDFNVFTVDLLLREYTCGRR